jgi:hypothetical protein
MIDPKVHETWGWVATATPKHHSDHSVKTGVIFDATISPEKCRKME